MITYSITPLVVYDVAMLSRTQQAYTYLLYMSNCLDMFSLYFICSSKAIGLNTN